MTKFFFTIMTLAAISAACVFLSMAYFLIVGQCDAIVCLLWMTISAVAFKLFTNEMLNND